jgi:hypothetical protein
MLTGTGNFYLNPYHVGKQTLKHQGSSNAIGILAQQKGI